MKDKTPPNTSSPSLEQDPDYALSRPSGWMKHARDFDWYEKNVPCQTACPAGTDIPGYLAAVAAGDHAKAYRMNLEANVFPGVLGRVCTRPCEPVCRHGWEGLGESVAICWAKRAADDHMLAGDPVVLEPLFPSSGKRIAIVGAGAAGLTVARELTRWGHQVVVFEKHDKPGGMMQQGIPEFRLPRAVVDREIAQIVAAGVEIRCGVALGEDLSLEDLKKDFDAVVLSAGTFLPNQPDIPGIELEGVRHGVDFLKQVNAEHAAEVGERVVVVGGGFTAVDCVRIARRLGSKDVTLVYRRRPEDSYIPAEEFEALEREGIKQVFQAAPAECLGNTDDGDSAKVGGMRFIRTEPDAEGRPVPIAGSEFELPADLVLLGTGQAPNTKWIDAALSDELLNDGTLRSGADPTSPIEGMFIAGDFGTGPSSLIDSVGHAKSCARRVDVFLMGSNRFEEVLLVEDCDANAGTGRTRAMDEIPRQEMRMLPMDTRGLIDEVESGLTADVGQTEAERCYLCNFKFEIDNDLCIYCDRCLLVMPVDNCIVKASNLIFDEKERIAGYQESSGHKDYNLLYLDQNECIRCGACVDVCPVDCITLQKVTKVTRPKIDAAGE